MNTRVDKAEDDKGQSALNRQSHIKNGGEATFQPEDNRPGSIAQQRLQEMACNSPQAMKSKALQAMAQKSPQTKQAAQVQLRADNHFAQQRQIAQKKESRTGLPGHLKAGMEILSGMSLDDVKVHRNSDKPAQLQAHAYAQGTDIHLGPGQEKHLPHEAWHVVQQKQGRVRPTTQMKGEANVNDDAGLEKEADAMGSIANQNAQAMQLKKQAKIPSRPTVQLQIKKNQDTSPSLAESDLEGLNQIDATSRNKWLEAARAAYLQEKKEQQATQPFSLSWLKRWGLNGAEIAAIQLYTTSCYQQINDFLRSGFSDPIETGKMCRMVEGWSLDDAEFIRLSVEAGEIYEKGKEHLWKPAFSRVVKLIISGMQKLPAPKEEKVSRGTALDNRATEFGRRYNDLHQMGNVVVDPAFLSTAIGVPFAKDSLIVISLPATHPGRNLSGLSALEPESEMLFPPGTGYRIDEILTVEHEDFSPILEGLVPNKTERDSRFSVVKRIFKATLIPPAGEH